MTRCFMNTFSLSNVQKDRNDLILVLPEAWLRDQGYLHQNRIVCCMLYLEARTLVSSDN
jgi:hypothetical protein